MMHVLFLQPPSYTVYGTVRTCTNKSCPYCEAIFDVRKFPLGQTPPPLAPCSINSENSEKGEYVVSCSYWLSRKERSV